MEMGHRIANARKHAGMSQSQLARACAVTRGLVAQWEINLKKPGRDNLAKIARATLVTTDYLIGDTPFTRIRMYISDPEQLALLRDYARLNPRQRDNLRQVLSFISAQATPEPDPQGDPVQHQQVVVGKHPHPASYR